MKTATTTINFKIDRNIKLQFEQFSNDIGISISSLLNCFVKKTLDEHKIPFEISVNNNEMRKRKAIAFLDKVSGSWSDWGKELGIKTEQDAYDFCYKFRRGLIK